MSAPDKPLRKISWEEIEKHRDSTSLWVVISNNIYDVTEFMEEHPGGEEVILEHAGRDATDAFEDVGHSPDAREIQKQYLVGELETPVRGREEKTSHITTNTNTNTTQLADDNRGGSSWSTTGLIILFLVLLVAYVYRNYPSIFSLGQ